MAAHKATVSVSASVLPDDMKASVGGTIVYDLNDIGNNNKWVYFANNVSTTAQSIMADGVSYLAGNAGDETAVVDADADDLGFLVLKHSGYQGDGTTTSTDNLYLNIAHGGDADAAAGGNGSTSGNHGPAGVRKWRRSWAGRICRGGIRTTNAYL